MKSSVLVIDDSPTLRKVIKYYLSKYELVVKEANNGKKGLEEIDRGSYNLIILDMRMPVMSGMEVLKELKKRGPFKTPVLILSADTQPSESIYFDNIIKCSFLKKPFKPKELLESVRIILNLE